MPVAILPRAGSLYHKLFGDPFELVSNGVDLSRSGSRQVFWPIRFDLQLKTHASIGYGGLPCQLVWPEAKFC